MKQFMFVVFVVGLAAGAASIAVRSRSSGARITFDPSTISRAGLTHGLTADGQRGFRVVYAPTDDPDHQQIRELFVADGVLDRVAASLDRVLITPRPIDLQMVDCGLPNAFYDPDGHRIILCYELIGYFLETFRPHAADAAELGAAAIGATFFAFFHELGHALINELDLASTGREEDAADQVATLVLLDAGDRGVAMALAGAHWFGLLAEDPHRTPFWDEHGLDGQRFFNVLCMVYGDAPEARAGLVRDDVLPADRARRCPAEYARLAAAWDQLLAPHLR